MIEALRETYESAYRAVSFLPSKERSPLRFLQTNLEQLSEAAVTVLSHKTPIVRQCTQQFLTKCFAMSTQATLPKKLLKVYLTPLIKVGVRSLCRAWRHRVL